MHTLLIANRGEIVVRIARSAKAMGLQTVAVFSEADHDAPYLSHCDHAVAIGGSSAADSYLSIEKILRAAQASGADSIHPGYGFLSENPEFAEAVIHAGLVWVGPSVAAMRIMADKAQARAQAKRCGIPVLAGTGTASDDLQKLVHDAEALGWPIMIKASAGGGGRGIRLVQERSELQRALEGAHQEAKAAFGDGRLLLERALLSPRHIEIQIMADAHGRIIHLGERDCTVQRRHQKLIEEAPSPAVNPALRRQLGDAALALAHSVGYVGLGTVEFLLDTASTQDSAFFFIEMNTRLQVEHPVTEALISEDLVRWQLRIAAGESLTLEQDAMLERFEQGGHAIEARLCAEDPAKDHLPQSDKLRYWLPAPELRCDAALVSGQWVSPNYDSMLAKLISHAPTRDIAIQQLADGLDRTVCLGLVNNRGYLAQVLRSATFNSGVFDTTLLHASDAFKLAATPPMLPALAALIIGCLPRDGMRDCPDSWWNWRSSGHFSTTVPLGIDDNRQSLQVTMAGDTFTIIHDARKFSIDTLQVLMEPPADQTSPLRTTLPAYLEGRGSIQCRIDGKPIKVFFSWAGDTFWLQYHDTQARFIDQRLQSSAAQTSHAGNTIRAPMHGRISQICVQDNGSVSNGQLVVIMEAMKMEHHLLAPSDAQIEHVRVRIGDQVSSGQVLITLQLP